MDGQKITDVVITAEGMDLNGILAQPEEIKGIILFAHGSGSSRLSPRNQQVARVLNEGGFATLLFDLLSLRESEHDQVTAEYRFNIPLLSERLITAIDWAAGRDGSDSMPIGLFGASTGAAAALVAAAERPGQIRAVVSRGGRPDLADTWLPRVQAPTLFIVGGRDSQVILLNKQAAESMTAHNEIVIVPEATHLFEEPGKLEEVSRHAVNWFETYCTR